MEFLRNMPAAGAVVVVLILILFALALALLFAVYGRYRLLTRRMAGKGIPDGGFVSGLREEFAAAYRQYGINVNTPAIIDNAVATRLSGLLLGERFMNNAVSLFVTLGLFGTFLGLSLSVTSLTELISLSNSEEWLSILNSVGGGLVSALSGMGVAFYTSLAGVACAIVFTLLRTVFNPQAQRERLQTAAELWLDQWVAPELTTEYTPEDATGLMALRDELKKHAASVQKSLSACTAEMERVLGDATGSLGNMIEYSKEPLTVFYDTVKTFNDNVRDFSEFNYDLRGNIERMDVCFRDLSGTVRQASKVISGGKQS